MFALPVLSSPTAAALNVTMATAGCSTDQPATGILYWYISTSATPPTRRQLRKGTGAVVAGKEIVVAGASQTVPLIEGLTGGSNYYAHMLQRNDWGFDSNIVTSALFTTTAGAPDYSFVFGALTRNGHGGRDVGTAVGITGGDTLAEWTIVSNQLVPAQDGVTVGDYTLTLNTGDTVELKVIANRYDVLDDTELTAVLALGTVTLADTAIWLVGTSYAARTLSALDFSGGRLTIGGTRTAVMARLAIADSQNILVRGFRLYDTYNAGAGDTGTSALLAISNEATEDLEIFDLEISDQYIGNVTMQADIELLRGIRMADYSIGTVKIHGCYVHDVSRLALVTGDVMYICNNDGMNFYAHPTQFSPSREYYSAGNEFWAVWGNGTDPGSPHMSVWSINPIGLTDPTLFAYGIVMNNVLWGASVIRYNHDGKPGGASGPKWNDMPAGYWYGTESGDATLIYNNLVVVDDVNGFVFGDSATTGGCRNFKIWNNSVLREDVNYGTTQLIPNLDLDYCDDMIVANNVARQIEINDTNTDVQEFNCVSLISPLTTTTGRRAFDEALVGPTWHPETIDDLLDQFARLSSGSLDTTTPCGWADNQLVAEPINPTKSASAEYEYPGVRFDADQYLTRTGLIASDTKTLTVAFAVQMLPGSDAVEKYILNGPNSARIRLFSTGTGNGVEVAFKSGITEVINFRSFNHVREAWGLQVLVMSFDLENGIVQTICNGQMHDGMRVFKMLNSTVSVSTGTWSLMAQTGGTLPVNGDLYYFGVWDQFTDLYANMDLFINTSDQPIDLGALGANIGTASRWSSGDASYWNAGPDGWTMVGTVSDATGIPPTLTLPVYDMVTTTTARIGATTDTSNGFLYGVVVASGSTPPSAAQVKAGLDGDNNPALWDNSASPLAITTIGAKTLDVTGLTLSTPYDFYLAHESDTPELSNVVTGSFTTLASGYDELLTNWEIADYMNRSPALDDGGSPVTNGPYGMIFMSVNVGAMPAGSSYFFSHALDFYLRREATGAIRVHVEDTAGGVILDHSAPGGWFDERLNILVALQRNATSRLYIDGSIRGVSTGTDTSTDVDIKFDYSGQWEVGARTTGTSGAAFEFARLAFWKLASPPPDITLQAVRDNFYNDSTKKIEDPATSIAAYGQPLIDFYGDAATLNAGDDQSTNGNNFVMNGTVTDIGEVNVDLVAAPGVLQVAGTVATIQADALIDGVAGAITVTGGIATVEVGTAQDALIAAVAGSIDVTGSVATVQADADITAVAGSVEVAGAVATVTADANIDAVAGAVTITGGTATVQADVDIAGVPGAIEVTGGVATIVSDVDITAVAGELVVTGGIATVTATDGEKVVGLKIGGVFAYPSATGGL